MPTKFSYCVSVVAVAVFVQAWAGDACGSQSYWLCSDAAGNKTAQDHPCDAAHPERNRKPVPVANSLPAPLPVPAPVASVMSDAGVSLPAFVTLKTAEQAGGIAGLLLLLVVLIRRLGAARDARDIEEKPQLQQPKAFWPLTRRPRGWSLELIRVLEWKRFDRLCAALWSADGYRAELTGNGSDGGVDVRLYAPDHPDQLAAIIQCQSRCSKPVSVKAVRALFENIHHVGARQGILVSSAEFASDAMIYAGGKSIELVGGEGLLKKLRSLDELAQKALLKELARGDYRTPSCPQCDARMVKRRSLEGPLWRCRNYPGCQHSFVFQQEDR